MSLVDSGSGMYMPVAPAGGYGNGFGGFGDGSFWIIVLFLFALMGNGWGNAFGGNGAFPMMMNTNNDVQRGFDQQSVMGGIAALQAGQNGIANSLCSGFAGVESGAAGRAMANLQQQFAMQTAIDSRLDTLAMNQQNGICENRQAIADVKYAIAMDGASTRSNTDAKVQMVMDKLCQLELDNVKQNYENRIAGMQSQIDALQGLVNNANRDVALANEVDALYNRLNNCPVPTTPVYGRTPIFTCNNGGCGCNG